MQRFAHAFIPLATYAACDSTHLIYLPRMRQYTCNIQSDKLREKGRETRSIQSEAEISWPTFEMNENLWQKYAL